MEINFYCTIAGNLVSSVVRILEKIYGSNKRCVLFSPIEERIKLIDKTLWTFSTNAFIPHGDKSLGFSEQQPIYLTDNFNVPNDAEILVLIDSLDFKKHSEKFEKIVFMFESQDSEKALALYNDLKKNQENVNYWEQTPKGWQKLT